MNRLSILPRGSAAWLLVLLSIAAALPARAGNPFITSVHAADPSAHVWPGDTRLWLYTSHDQPGTNTHDTMVSYHVFSSENLVDWTDYGAVFHLGSAPWAAGYMWAIDCVRHDGLYYLVYCAVAKEDGQFYSALATSPLPQGPFTDLGPIRGTAGGQDPALFVDGDGQAYLYWGGGNSCHAARLTADLRSVVPGSKVDLTPQLKWVYEGPWMHRYRGRYYLTYPGLLDRKWPERMYYAIGDHPLGPFEFKGEYIPLFPGAAGTNHGSVIEYKGRWLAFHHSAWITGHGACRNLMCDYIEYNPDGTIKPIIPTKEGVALDGAPPGPSRVTMRLEAENGAASLGELWGTTVATERAGYTGNGYVTGLDSAFAGVTVLAQAAGPARYRLKIRYAAPEADQRNKLMVNYTLLDDPASPDPGRFDKALDFPQAATWTEKDAGIITLEKGDNTIRVTRVTGGIDIDCLILEPVET